MTKKRMRVCCSALGDCRNAGWMIRFRILKTRVRTALAALEQSGYLERGTNVPHVYATGITVKNMDEARKRITASVLFHSDEIRKGCSDYYFIDLAEIHRQAQDSGLNRGLIIWLIY